MTRENCRCRSDGLWDAPAGAGKNRMDQEAAAHFEELVPGSRS